MSLIIGLTGAARAGKNTVGQIIAEELAGSRVELAGFADKLKISAARALGLDFETEYECIAAMDDLKVAGEVCTADGCTNESWTISGREFLQRYGTESHRDVFGEDFWVDATLPVEVVVDHGDGEVELGLARHVDFDVLVITDVRFENEAQRIKDLGGQVWKVVRPEADNWAINTGADHMSEAGVDDALIDRYIFNEDGLEDLRWYVRDALEDEVLLEKPKPLYGEVKISGPGFRTVVPIRWDDGDDVPGALRKIADNFDDGSFHLGPFDNGVVCEEHPDTEWPHDDECEGAGMPRPFAVGDRVKIDEPSFSDSHGKLGTITTVYPECETPYVVLVDGTDDYVIAMLERELKPVTAAEAYPVGARVRARKVEWNPNLEGIAGTVTEVHIGQVIVSLDQRVPAYGLGYIEQAHFTLGELDVLEVAS